MKKFLLFIISLILISLISFRIYSIYKNVQDIKLLSEVIMEDSNLKDYTYKGNVSTNYVEFNNLLWQVVKINPDKSILLILEDYITILENNDIDTYLSNFEEKIDTSYLKDKVSLLDPNDYLNSIENDTTFITDTEIWLNNNTISNKLNLSKDVKGFYPVKPTITLKANTRYTEGDGTIENPYQVDGKKFGFGSTVTIDNDEYMVIDTKEDIKLISMFLIDNLYLNDYKEYKDKLSYKEYIKDITLPSLNDCNFNSKLTNYYLSDTSKTFNLVYSYPLTYGDGEVMHQTRLVITIDKKIQDNFKYLDGSWVLQ